MPTYEYTCPDGHEFERFYRKISDAASDVVCPVCGKPAVRKLSASGFAFKGSGFYLTDYGKNAHRGTGEVVGAGEKSGGESGSSESKSDGKPAESASPAKSAEPSAAPAKASETKSSESKPASSPSTSSSTAPKSDK